MVNATPKVLPNLATNSSKSSPNSTGSKNGLAGTAQTVKDEKPMKRKDVKRTEGSSSDDQ